MITPIIAFSITNGSFEYNVANIAFAAKLSVISFSSPDFAAVFDSNAVANLGLADSIDVIAAAILCYCLER